MKTQEVGETLTHDGWWYSGHTDNVNTFVSGFTDEEQQCLGGPGYSVRVICGVPPHANDPEFLVCDEEGSFLMHRMPDGRQTDASPPADLIERIRTILPPLCPEEFGP